ncbi:hypothetical protein QV12_04580 [Pseudomonas putida]|nr:hypothetical protein QV12_04580 [Pseudomonas putida]
MRPSKLIGIVADNARSFEHVLRDAEQQLASATERQMALEQDILTRLRSIATLQLEHAPSLQDEVVQALHERQLAQGQLRQQLLEVEQQIAQSLEATAQVQERLDDLDRQARDQLAQDPTYTAQMHQLEQAIAANLETVTGYADIRQECADKLPMFDRNPIYHFLRDRDFGTEQYRLGRISRWLDGWLARQVDYNGNRSNELNLLNMQQRNEALQLERDAHIAALEQSTGQQLADAQQQAGMEPLREAHKALYKQTVASKQQANDIHAQLTAFTHNQDPHYLRARQWLTDQLQAKSIEQLLEQVKKTPDTADDQIALQLQRLYPQVDGVERALAEARQTHGLAQQSYDRAKELERALRTDFFRDDGYQYKATLGIERLLSDYMTRDVTLSYLVGTIREHRELVPRVAVERSSYSSSSSGSSWSSSSSSNSSSSSSSSGGFSSSDSSGGGGFRTSDSF